MADRTADNAELIVDEMRRKARRRLVGAIVLALAAALLVPMLLEKEPRPLGDDVSVQIPPVDQSKFVNRLTGKTDTKAPMKSDGKPVSASGKADGKSETRTEAAPDTLPSSATGPAPSKTDAATVAKAEATSKAETAPASNAGSAAAPKAEPAAPTSAEAKAEPKSPSKADTKSIETTVASTAPTSASPTVAGSPSPAGTKADGAFVVQLAAFADDKGANALANKLKKNGYSAYVEPINTSRGTLWRVRVGGYGTRPEADVARVALKGEGYSGIIAQSQ